MQQTTRSLAITLGLSWLTATAVAHDGAPDSFTLAVDQAWTVSQQQQLSGQRLAEIEAQRQSNQSWFAATPELTGRYTGDQLDQDNGTSEVELELELPLWQRGQKTAVTAALDSHLRLQHSAVMVEKLAVAGIVRELYWEVILKRNALQTALGRLQAAEKIADDVQRHIDNGVLADADQLLARAEVLSAQAEQLTAKQELYVAERSYLARTGHPQVGHWIAENQGKPIELESHPKLQHAMAVLQARRFDRQVVQLEGREPSRLSIGWISERESRDDPSSNRFQIGFNMPLGQDRSNRSMLAEANTELLEAEVRLTELKRELEASRVIAITALASARLHQQSAQLQQQTSRRRVALASAAFSAGELGLQEMLTTRNQADATEQDGQRRQIEVARAISRLNQALGYLPQKMLAEGNQQ